MLYDRERARERERERESERERERERERSLNNANFAELEPFQPYRLCVQGLKFLDA